MDMLPMEGRAVVEVDGPAHFVQGPDGCLPLGSTVLKRRQLDALGYRVVSVPFSEWDQLRSGDEEMACLSVAEGHKGCCLSKCNVQMIELVDQRAEALMCTRWCCN